MNHRHLRYIVKQGEQNMQKFKNEQQFFWDTFNDIWPGEEKEKSTTSLPDEVDNFIIDKIKDALVECNNNRTHAAERLGIKRETLLAKMRKYFIR
jgi:DNA-binding NtrC family response regulator